MSSLLALAAAVCAAPASAKLTWIPHPAPGPVTSVAVASNDIPFVSTGGRVFYLGRGKGACSGVPRLCADKWIEIPGINTHQLSMPVDGVANAIEATSGRLMDAVAPRRDLTRIAIPDTWQQTQAWRPGCVTSAVVTGADHGHLYFVTPPGNGGDWRSDIYAVGCEPGADKSLWILRRFWSNSVPTSSPWRQLAVRQGATSSKVALFTRFMPAGPVEEVWFMDSIESGGRTWIYDQVRDIVVERLNPKGVSTKPDAPRARGTAITDHHARFISGPTGKTYRWDDYEQSWTFLLNDPESAQIQNLAYGSYYESIAGGVGPSQLWANDTAGTLYFMRDVGPVN